MRVLAGLMAAALVASALGAAPAFAETQTEYIVAEQRTSVSMRAPVDGVQALLPAGWTVAAAPGAPNISFIFMDRKLALLPDGKPMGAGVNLMLVISVGAKNAKTGEVKGLIVGGYSADPTNVPGAYGVYGAGTVDVTRTERVAGTTSNSLEERWSVKAADGGVLTVDLAFARGVPKLGAFELKVHSGKTPDFYRIYRGEQAMDVARGPGVDRVTRASVTASGGKLGAIIGEGVEVIGVSNAPYYSRKTFLP